MGFNPGGGGGGSSSIGTSTDVSLNNLANGESLTYDSGIGKWKNTALSGGGTLADGSVTYAKLSASGATTGQVLSYSGSSLAWATPGGLTGP